MANNEPASDYGRDGYLIIPGLLDPAALDAMQQEATAICSGLRGDVEGLLPASGLDELACLRQYLCIHFPHKISPLARELGQLTPVVDALTAVIGPNVKMVQSMLFIKASRKPGQAWHQDEAHIPTRDRSLTAAWIALDDATIDNGCLWVIPGSHRPGVLYPVRDHNDIRFDHTREAHGFDGGHDAVPVEVAGGDAVLFNGYLLHRSLPNARATGMRRALVNHYMSAESLLPWLPPKGSEPMAMLDHRDIVMVAGVDPYEASGTTDVMRPHLRRE